MSPLQKIVSLTCLIAMALLTQSCIFEGEHDCDGRYYVQFTIDNHWTYAPDATAAGMAYFFFPENGDHPWRFDIQGMKGGEVRLPDGNYRFLTVNDDYSNVILENETSYATIEATTLPAKIIPGAAHDSGVPKRVSAPGEEVRKCPDMLWSFQVSSTTVEPDQLRYTADNAEGKRTESSYSPHMVLPTYPRSIVSTYHVVVEDITNLEGAIGISGSMSGMSSSIRLSDESRSTTPVTLPIELKKDGPSSARGDFLTFGLTACEEVRNILSIYVRLSDGRGLSYEIDVTEQTKAAPDPMDVWIRVSGPELPEPGEPGGAFEVEVDNWNTIVINITD